VKCEVVTNITFECKVDLFWFVVLNNDPYPVSKDLNFSFY